MKLNDITVNYLAQFCFGAAAIAFTPVSGGVTAGVGATALVALFHAERKKKKAAAQLDSDKALSQITAKIADTWRDNLPAEGRHEYLKQVQLAEETLHTALPYCTMDYATLAGTTTEGAGKFPDKATNLVMAQLADIAPEAFGQDAPDLSKAFARDVIQSAFMGAIENEAYFSKFEPQLLLAIAEKLGDIYDMQVALKELAERNYETLAKVDARTKKMDVKLDQLLAIVGSLALKRAEEIGLNAKQIETITLSFLDQQIPTELWGEKLVEGATRLIQLEEDLARLTNDEVEIAAIITLAREAIDRGDIDGADQHLAEAVRRDEEAGEKRLRRAAKNEGRRGDLAMTEGRYIKAADHFARAARLIRPFDAEDRARLKHHEANAAYERGILDPERKSLDRSVSAYREALKEWTRDRVPLNWATTQNNLGNALATLGERGDEQALKDAITAYRDALKEYTRDRVPLDWATTQNNLGNALRVLGERGDEQALKDAITAYRDALKEKTRDRVPLDWAMTQNNLGNALRVLGARGDEQALKNAIAAYRDALKEWTTDRVPLNWAMTQGNLANAFETLGDRDQSTEHWVTARNHSLFALEEFTGRAPAYEAAARRNLARVEAKLKAAGWAPPEG
ncbi:MAG: hypothetical protein CME94_08955 [Hyphomonadaceae bacterium]|nr:hypothetical protein [Hyphomonadaceae bacterium]